MIQPVLKNMLIFTSLPVEEGRILTSLWVHHGRDHHEFGPKYIQQPQLQPPTQSVLIEYRR